MAADRIQAISALLKQAEEAHATYETTELNGVYDQEWARWYAAYAVEHGIGERIGHHVSTDDLAQFLDDSYGRFEQADAKPGEPWAAYTARRIAAEL